MREYKGLYFDQEFIFIHVPKVAGKSIHRSIMNKINLDLGDKRGGTLGGHIPAVFYQDNFYLQFKSFFKFAFVRNPWDRICSAFHYVHACASCSPQGLYEDVTNRFDERSFNSFIKEGLFRYWVLPHFRPQTYWILDDHGENHLDFVGRYENLHEDFNFVCERVGVERGNLGHYGNGDSRVNDRLPYQEYYDQEMIDIVAEIYRHDIELFGYDFR